MRADTFVTSLDVLTDAHRAIRLRLWTAEGITDDLLLVKYVSGVETMCGGVEYVLQCVSTQAGMELKEFIANPVEVQFVTDCGGIRTVSGIVGGAIEGQSDGGLATYQLIVRDALSLMEQACNTRIFRNCNEIDITEIVLEEWMQKNPILAGAFHVKYSSLKAYPKREFTMQSNESDVKFLHRLWKRRGISWFIESKVSTKKEEIPSHTLVLFDNPDVLAENPAGAARYHRDNGAEQRDSITAWHAVRNLTAGRVTRRSWDYKRAWSMNSHETNFNDQGSLGSQFAASIDEYLIDPPHTGDDTQDYRNLGVLRMQRKEYESKMFLAESGDRDMRVGQWRRINGHPEIDTHAPDQRTFVCTELRVEAENNLPTTFDERVSRLFALNRWKVDRTALAQASAERGMRYTNRFSCVRRGIPILAAYEPRTDLPRTEPQTAIVVGPADQEIYCDELGRIKVSFPGCRREDHDHANGAGASGTDRDSAWVRVASSWAGSRYGALSLPRIGDEVVVIFMGGDPDKPLVIGSVHGGKTPAPSFNRNSVLPGDKYLSGIISKEGQGNRANQLRLDDTPGQISVQLASEHAHSQLNLGYLTHPRNNGLGDPRGDGAELRTDATLSLRGAQGILISADASLRAAGRQLERNGLMGLTDALLTMLNQLSKLAVENESEAADDASLSQLKKYLDRWEKDENNESRSANGENRNPIVAVEAPAGMIFGSQAGVVVGAQTDIDMVSVRNTQLSAGRKLLLHAFQGIRGFAHALGIKLIAASGKVEVQAHDDNVEITSAKRVVITATEEIVLQSPKINIISQGAQTNISSGTITHQCKGNFIVKSAKAEFSEAGGGGEFKNNISKSEVAYDQRIRVVDMNTGDPLVNQRYRITLEDGQVIEGRTGEDGLTQEFTSDIPFGNYQVETLFD